MERYKRERERFEDIISFINFKEIPVFRGLGDKWLATEEIVLLTSLQHFNHGNWTLLAEILTKKCKKKFTPKEVQDHYNNTYMKGHIAEAMKGAQSNIFKCSLTDHTTKEDDEWLKSADINAHRHVPPEFLKKIGYMPLREDFKEEYEPTAEELIHRLNFTNVNEHEKNVNLKLLNTYRNKIQKRIKMKAIVKQYRLMEQYYTASLLYKFLDNKSSISNSENVHVQFHNSKNETDDLSLSSKKSGSKLNSAGTNQEKKVQPVSDCDEEEETTIRKCKSRRKCKEINNNTLKLSSVQSESSSENESVESTKKVSSFPSNNNPRGKLTEAEKKLCKGLGLKPVYYTRYKDFIISKDLESEGKHTAESMIPEHMTVAQCLRIINFLKKSGWITQNLLNTWDV